MIVVLAAVLLLFGRAAASDRVDLYDTQGRRTGYAIVDRSSGRVDFYDPLSRRMGYGQVDTTGRVERFDANGRRQDPTVLPVPRVPTTR